ncbi:MAG: DUF192 domain-containing protein [Candidatus Hydrothermarchaeota archaeon]
MEYSIVNTTKSMVLAHTAKIANNFFSRFKGLMLKTELKDGSGLIIDLKKERKWASIHTFFMRFPIDLIYVDSNNIVKEVVEDLRPWRLYFPKNNARYVIELPAGILAATKTEVGDEISLEEADFSSALTLKVQSRKNVTKALTYVVRNSILSMKLKSEVYYNPNTGGLHVGGPDKYFVIDALEEIFGDDIEISEGKMKFMKDDHTLVVRVKRTLPLIKKLKEMKGYEESIILKEIHELF